MHNFIIPNVDTDSITICKSDMTPFTPEEQEFYLKDLNSLFPPMIEFTHDGYFEKVICVKTKNYILYDGEKTKIKGSALKKSTSEKAIKEYFNRFIDLMVAGKMSDLVPLYEEYVKEIMNVNDISRWCSKKSVTDKVLNGTRTNETKVMDAIGDSEVSEGDKVYVFFKTDESLCLVENFDGDYNKNKLLEKLFKATKTFETVVDIDMFKNYKLKKNKPTLEKLCAGDQTIVGL